MARHRLGLFMLALAGTLTASGCGDDNGVVSVRITAPPDRAQITLTDDVDDRMPGIQLDVDVTTNGLGDSDMVSLYIGMPGERPTPGMPGPADAEVAPGADGAATLRITLSETADSYDITACARECRASDTITISVNPHCATITFLVPAPGAGGSVTLGPEDDQDGEACGATFATTVRVFTDAPSGNMAQIFVNGTPGATVDINGDFAEFPDVTLGNRGATPNTLAVSVRNADGVDCRSDFPGDVFVDCEGLSCAITEPGASTYLNSMDDVSAGDPGFQGNFEVTTDGEGPDLDMPVRLVIDGDESGALSAPQVMVGSGGQATFANVDLDEGPVTVQAICTDNNGVETRSTEATWIVDSVPCTIGIDDPVADTVFNDSDDVDPGTAGIQIGMSGTFGGADCTGVEVGACGALGDAAMLAGTDWTAETTLGSGARQDLCAEVTDMAGNLGEAMVTIGLRTDAPQLEIVTPTTGTAYNIAGTGGRTADLTPASATCEAAFSVRCTEVGVPVTLELMGGGALAGGSADCVAMGGLPPPYTGVATFASVSLSSRNDCSAVNVVARQDADGLTGFSSAVALTPDCEAPEALSFISPTCGQVLRPSMDNACPGAGFQYRVIVGNTNIPKPDVTLEIRDSGGMLVGAPMTTGMPAGMPRNEFPCAEFGAAGTLTMTAGATDCAGNPASIDCDVTVGDLPTITITQPMNGAVLTQADDCNAGAPGLQIRVRATTDAPAGSAASVTVGAGMMVPTTVMGGAVDLCVDAADGRSVPVVVRVTNTVGTSMATVLVGIDTVVPPIGIALMASVQDRRGGIIRFSWTAVADGGFPLASYELRCAATAITTEGEWSAATVVPMMSTPAAAGTPQTEDIGGFRPPTNRQCALRGRDIAGRLTPIGANATVVTDFLTQTLTQAGGLFGQDASAVGDVNNDGFNDVLVGSGNGGTNFYLYFGAAAGLPAMPSVTITGPAIGAFGTQVRGIGDFNGDAMADVLLGTPNASSSRGQAFILFGRMTWPAAISLASGGCGADLCFTGAAANDLLGQALAEADFNGDGLMDAVIGGSGNQGRVFIILGSSGFAAASSFTLPDPGAPAGFQIGPIAGMQALGGSVVSPGAVRGGDSRHEVVIGAPGSGAVPVTGRLLMVDGRNYPAAGMGLVAIADAEVTTIDTGLAGFFGATVAALDYDGNALTDIVVRESTSMGVLYVYPNFGAASLYPPAMRKTIPNNVGVLMNDLFGTTVAGGYHPWLGTNGDVNGDGRSDLLTGSNERGDPPGALDLFFGEAPWSAGSRNRSDSNWVFQPAGSGGSDRRVGRFLGDVNDDGHDDMLAGDRQQNRVFYIF